MRNFFEHQDQAHRTTTRLILLFGAAVLMTIVALYLVVTGAFYVERLTDDASHMRPGQLEFHWWNGKAFLISAVGTILVVGGGTWYKISELAEGGGSMVCEELGGRFLDFRTDDAKEQMLINIVEEMSIASGVSVPLLYVLDEEPGINAFAAGFNTNNAAIAVSRGCLELLTRDELQGVIAHEYSHILNGDMRMNIRMIGILHGILMVALAGSLMMRIGLGGSHRSSYSSSKREGGLVYLIVLGAALYIIGYVGRLFGQIIKSAISRQREFLADASAVQFTRNPTGIGGALQKIGGYASGSKIDSPNADECSHLFFGDALDRSWLTQVFATHPPLEERIERILPDFSGQFPNVEPPALDEATKEHDGSPAWQHNAGTGMATASSQLAGGGRSQSASYSSGSSSTVDSTGQTEPQTFHIDPGEVVGKSGTSSNEHVEHARGLIDAIPPQLRQDAKDTYSAASVVFALLIASDDRAQENQYVIVEEMLTPGLADETRRRVDLIAELRDIHRLPMVELLIPSLRKLGAEQHDQFVEIIDELIFADDHVTLFEFCLEKLLYHRLEPEIQSGSSRVAKYHSLTPLRNDLSVLLSRLAYIGHETEQEVEDAFTRGRDCIHDKKLAEKLTLLTTEECGFAPLETALTRIGDASSGVKQQVVDAIAHVVLADDEVTVEEAEILRAVCEVIDIPLPPFLPS